MIIDEKKHPVVFGVYKFFSGSASGVVAATILQPMDVIKTRQQGYYHKATLQNGSIAENKQFLRWQVAAKNIYKERGVVGYWDGLSPSLIRVTFGVGLYYYLLHLFLKDETNGRPNINHKSLYSLGSGFVARSICSTIMLPITIVKTRMEYNKAANDTILHTCKNILKVNRSGLFSGLIPTILRDAPNSGLYICIYHTIKPHIMKLNTDNNSVPVTLLTLLTGITAGITSTFITHPFDMIKTQMQINDGDPNYLTVRSTVRTILRDAEGTSGLRRCGVVFRNIYTGGFMRITKRALNSTITWTIYETMDRWVKK
ncbi:hypothetical protein WA588_005641, partial [Blastocystis sp. NMH]